MTAATLTRTRMTGYRAVSDAIQVHESIGRHYQLIGLPPPRHPQFDVHRIEETLPLLKREALHSFRCNFYQLSLLAGLDQPTPAEDSQQLQVGSRRYDIRNTILVGTGPRHVHHWHNPHQNQPLTGHILFFTDTFLGATAYNTKLLRSVPFFQAETTNILYINELQMKTMQDIYDKILAEFRSDNPDRLAFVQYYLPVLLQYAKRYFGQNQAAVRHGPEPGRLVNAFFDLLDTCEQPASATRHTAGQFAERLSVHPIYLNRLLKQTTGRTVSELLADHCLTEARHLLCHTTQTVAEIAWQLGFSDPAYFHRFFKKYTGQTPGDFRVSTRC